MPPQIPLIVMLSTGVLRVSTSDRLMARTPFNPDPDDAVIRRALLLVDLDLCHWPRVNVIWLTFSCIPAGPLPLWLTT